MPDIAGCSFTKTYAYAERLTIFHHGARLIFVTSPALPCHYLRRHGYACQEELLVDAATRRFLQLAVLFHDAYAAFMLLVLLPILRHAATMPAMIALPLHYEAFIVPCAALLLRCCALLKTAIRLLMSYADSYFRCHAHYYAMLLLQLPLFRLFIVVAMLLVPIISAIV